jgi:predicted lactoylglutathione lyase
MLLTEAKFKTFPPKEICDATKSKEVFMCLSSESRAKKLRKPVESAAARSTKN